MTFIVAEKHKNLQKSIAVICSAIVLASCGNKPSALVGQRQLGNSGRFADLCREKASLSPEAKHTVEVLLKYVLTTECDAADRQLSSLTALNLDSTQISDIKPLASLTKLTNIALNNNQIRDIKPLASLTNLKWLFLGRNPIAPKTCPLKPESICNWEPRFYKK